MIQEDGKHVTYPRWWIAKAAARKERLDAAVVLLRDQIVRIDGVTGVLLFGSYARNDVGPDSDLDFIVIQESTLSQTRRTAALYEQLDLGAPFDAIVYTREEFQRLSETRLFVAQALAEGRWLVADQSS